MGAGDLFPAVLSRIFLIFLAIMVLVAFLLQWEQAQRLKFLGVAVGTDALSFEIANYGTAYVGKTDYVGSVAFLSPDQKSVSLFKGSIDLIPPSRAVTSSLSFDAPIVPPTLATAETSVTQLCLYTRGRLYFDTHFHKVYFRHRTTDMLRRSDDVPPDLEIAEYEHVFFGRPPCEFVGSGNYFSYEIDAANIDCKPIGEVNETVCHTEGVLKSTLEGIFDPVQTSVDFDFPERELTRAPSLLRN